MRTSVTEQVLAHNFIYIQTSFTFRILVNLTVSFHIPYYKSIWSLINYNQYNLCYWKIQVNYERVLYFSYNDQIVTKQHTRAKFVTDFYSRSRNDLHIVLQA